VKESLRKQLRAQRRSLSDYDHRRRSLAAAKAIMRLRRFSAGKRVALYLPFDCEVDTAALIGAAQQRGVQIFVPFISDRRRWQRQATRHGGRIL
jgi:5-formyltetrahydrofolate cyclo-ligase